MPGTTNGHGSNGSVEVTVRSILEMGVMEAGAPEVAAGEAGLDGEIRWAHSGDYPNVTDLLVGGELLLISGLGLADDSRSRRRFVEQLAKKRLAALVLQLGLAPRNVPATLAKAAVENELPLIFLHREVPSIEVIEEVNKRLLDRDLSNVRDTDELQRSFTQIMLDGAGIPEVLGLLAKAIGNPVILEREGGELIYHSPHVHDSSEVLSAWDSVSRGLPGAPQTVSVDLPTSGAEPHARLVVLGKSQPFLPVTSSAMGRAADLLALVTMQSRQEEILVARERGNLLARFLESDLAEQEMARQVDSMGFPQRVPYLLPCVLAATGPGRAPRASASALWSSVWQSVRKELDSRRVPVLGGLMPSSHELGMVVGLATPKQRDERADLLADLFAKSLEREVGSATAGLLFVGDACGNWSRSIKSLREVAEAARTPRLEAGTWYDATSPDLERLLWSLRGSGEMLSFIARRLGPLLAHDKARGAMLTATLETFLECGGNKTETARKLHLERQSLYHRLNRIEELVGGSLSDEDTRLGLHLAVRARRFVPGIDEELP